MTAGLTDSDHDRSVRHMHHGIELLGRGDWQGALGHFDEAIRLRDPLPWRDDVQSAWLLAAAWINRSDALRRMENPAVLPDALRSLDLAIEAMNHVPLADNRAFPERLILAWINRATLCGEMEDFPTALDGFSRAGTLLETWGRDDTTTRRFLTAMLAVNRARVLLENDRPLPAWEDARTAAEVLHGVNAPSATLKAYSIQCRALAHLLDEPGGIDHIDDWIASATDASEAALALVKTSGCMDPWVADLVRYGAKIYRTCQPRFLAEFLTDWVIAGPFGNDLTLRREMQNELLLAQAELEQRVLSCPHDTDFVQNQTRILISIQTAARHLTFIP